MSTAERFPRLSQTLPGPRMPGYCQGCGRHQVELELADIQLITWIECDDNDSPLAGKPQTYVLLCTACDGADEDGAPLPEGKRQPGRKSKRSLIDRHPRLYERPIYNGPVFGAMDMCRPCVHRDGLSCKCPSALFNGGPGMLITIGTRAFFDGTRGGRRAGWTGFSAPPSACAGFEPEPTGENS